MFDTHKLNPDGEQKAVGLERYFKQFLGGLEQLCLPEPLEGRAPGGREFALVKTHLEIASFYAKRVMAMQPENQTEVKDG